VDELLLTMCVLAAAPAAPESLVDFSKLPASALDKYIDHYRLVERYPPYPAKRKKNTDSPSSGDEDSRSGDEDDAERASKRIDSNQPVTTTTRLRRRSPNQSTANFYAGGANNKRNGEDEGEGALEGNGKDYDIPCPSHFFDAQEADNYLATVASRHFAAQPPPKEGEVVVQFLYRCRAGGR
jgi:hypothetical protein